MGFLASSLADLGPAFVSLGIQEVYTNIPGNNRLAPREALLAGYIAERKVDQGVQYAVDQSYLPQISHSTYVVG